MRCSTYSCALGQRFRRLVIWCTGALALLVFLGLACWIIIVPWFEVRAAAAATRSEGMSYPKAIEQLGGDSEALRKLNFCAKWSGRFCDREKIAMLLGHCGPEATNILQRMLEDEQQAVREAAIEGLGRIGQDAAPAGPKLAEVINRATGHELVAAALAHWQVTGSGDVAIPALLRALQNGSDVIQGALQCLGFMGPAARSAEPELLHRMETFCPENRVTAAETLWRISGDAPRTVDLLVTALQCGNVNVETLAAWGLKHMGTAAASATDALIEAATDLRGNSYATRAAAAEALGRVGLPADKTRVALQRIASEDPESWVKCKAQEALGVMARRDQGPKGN